MFDHQERQDPSSQANEEHKEDDQVIISDFLFYEKGEVLRTEAYYVTKQGHIRGVLRLNADYMHFEPIKCDENNIVRLFYL